MTIHFSLVAFKIPFFESLILICLSVSLSECILLEFTSFLDVYIHYFNQFWEVFSHYFFSSLYPFLDFSSGTPTVYVSLLMVSHVSLRLSSLFFNPFSFCFSDLIISIVLFPSSLILSSALESLWRPFHLSLHFSAPEFLFRFSIFTDISILFTHLF